MIVHWLKALEIIKNINYIYQLLKKNQKDAVVTLQYYSKI